VEAHLITKKDEIQADHFNSEGNVHNVLGQKRRSACGLLAQGSAINAGVCCNTLLKLHRMIQNKRRVMFSRGVVIIHDNTHPHTAMQNLITTFG